MRTWSARRPTSWKDTLFLSDGTGSTTSRFEAVSATWATALTMVDASPTIVADQFDATVGVRAETAKAAPDWGYDKHYHLWEMHPGDVVYDATGHTSFGIVSQWMGEVVKEPNRAFPAKVMAGAIRLNIDSESTLSLV